MCHSDVLMGPTRELVPHVGNALWCSPAGTQRQGHGLLFKLFYEVCYEVRASGMDPGAFLWQTTPENKLDLIRSATTSISIANYYIIWPNLYHHVMGTLYSNLTGCCLMASLKINEDQLFARDLSFGGYAACEIQGPWISNHPVNKSPTSVFKLPSHSCCRMRSRTNCKSTMIECKGM